MDQRIGRPLHVDVRSFLPVNSHVECVLLWSGYSSRGPCFSIGPSLKPLPIPGGVLFLGGKLRDHKWEGSLSRNLGSISLSEVAPDRQHRRGNLSAGSGSLRSRASTRFRPRKMLGTSAIMLKRGRRRPFGDADVSGSMYCQGTLRRAKLLKVVYKTDKLERVERKTEQRSSDV